MKDICREIEDLAEEIEKRSTEVIKSDMTVVLGYIKADGNGNIVVSGSTHEIADILWRTLQGMKSDTEYEGVLN